MKQVLAALAAVATLIGTALPALAHDAMLFSLRNLDARPGEAVAWFQIEMDQPAAITYRCKSIGFWTIATAQTDFEGRKVVLEGWTHSTPARLDASKLDALNNLLFLLRFDDEPEPPRLTGRIQYWRREANGVVRIREEVLKPDQIALEPRRNCPQQ
jgi:hypothetical protein